MNCENVEKLISAYVDRELPADLEPKIRYHLAYCERCFKTYSEIQKTKELLSSLKSQELPDSFWKETRARLRPHASRPAARPERRSSRLWTALATAACLLLTASVVSLAPDPPSGGGFVASTFEEAPATQLRTMSAASTGDRFGYTRSPMATRGTVQTASFGSKPQSFGIFGFGEILWSNSLDTTKDLDATKDQLSDSETSPEESFAAERNRPVVETHQGSPSIVPAGWSGGH